MLENHSAALKAPYEGLNIIGILITEYPFMVLTKVKDLTKGKHGYIYKRDILIFKNLANKRTTIYDALTLEVLWIIQNRSRK